MSNSLLVILLCRVLRLLSMRRATLARMLFLIPKTLSFHVGSVRSFLRAGAAHAKVRHSTVRMSSSKPSGKSKLIFLGVLPSFRPAHGVALWRTAARTARRRTGRPTTSSTVSLKLTEHRSSRNVQRILRVLIQIQPARGRHALYA